MAMDPEESSTEMDAQVWTIVMHLFDRCMHELSAWNECSCACWWIYWWGLLIWRSKNGVCEGRFRNTPHFSHIVKFVILWIIDRNNMPWRALILILLIAPCWWWILLVKFPWRSVSVLFPTVGMLGPRNLRVSDEWYTRFRVSWDPAPSRVNGYKLIYQPEGTDEFFWGYKWNVENNTKSFFKNIIMSLYRLWRVLRGACWRRHHPPAA